ncbi:hypothetical protein [Sphingomonas sp. CFBP 8765]|nr:hypothetical protein [Sphingomonas sp. CFBP 8765]MBD8471741.1 hypothetical protein [Sphingomonas sp. CFBP 8765]
MPKAIVTATAVSAILDLKTGLMLFPSAQIRAQGAQTVHRSTSDFF